MSLPNPYGYLDYRQFLKDWYAAKKEANPRFSHRAFVRRTGQRSPSLLKDVMEGRRNLTSATTDSFCKALSLTKPQSSFFRALVALDQAGTMAEKNRAWEQIAATKRFRDAQKFDSRSFQILSHWYISAVRELSYRPDFDPAPGWIASNVRPEITQAQAKKSLKLLLETGLLVQNQDGSIHPHDVSLATPHEVAGLAVHNYHLGMLEQAQAAITNFRPPERHFTSVTAAIPKRMLPEIKRELDAIQERLMEMCNVPEEPADQVVQIGLYCFPLSTVRKS